MQGTNVGDLGTVSPPRSISRHPRSPKVLAASDLWEGARHWWVWGLLSWYDIKKRYRGSVLGPFWLTLTTAVTIGSLGALNSLIMGLPLSSYLPHLSLGMILWALISALINESATAFTSVEHVIKQIKMPLSTQIYRIVNRNLIIFLHNTPIIFVVMIACHIPVGIFDVAIVPGLVLLILWIVPLSLLLGSIGARFRDVPQMVASILQLLFFLSPIMWEPSQLDHGGRMAGIAKWVTLFNPIASFVALIREPLVGRWPLHVSWAVCVAAVALTWAIAFPFFVRFRARIAYWA
jgi:ABC-type polysaccharide/polyol phosphate export permease